MTFSKAIERTVSNKSIVLKMEGYTSGSQTFFVGDALLKLIDSHGALSKLMSRRNWHISSFIKQLCSNHVYCKKYRIQIQNNVQNMFNVSSELVALCTFYQIVVQCLIVQHASRVQCQSYCGTST